LHRYEHPAQHHGYILNKTGPTSRVSELKPSPSQQQSQASDIDAADGRGIRAHPRDRLSRRQQQQISASVLRLCCRHRHTHRRRPPSSGRRCCLRLRRCRTSGREGRTADADCVAAARRRRPQSSVTSVPASDEWRRCGAVKCSTGSVVRRPMAKRKHPGRPSAGSRSSPGENF
uniref:GCM domain-containing protein n=1 Tax=Macrostomum lignano TaxID=282301 RepID=A0A1I8F9S6_9PLAT